MPETRDYVRHRESGYYGGNFQPMCLKLVQREGEPDDAFPCTCGLDDALKADAEPSTPAEPQKEAFEAGWCAGFQEALTEDIYPHRDRCADAYAEWVNAPPTPTRQEAEK